VEDMGLEMAAAVFGETVEEARDSLEMDGHLLLAWAVSGSGEYASFHTWHLPLDAPK